MALMRREDKELEGLGPVGIIREAFKLLTTHSRFFSSIQFTLLLPMAALAIACEYCFYWALYKDGNLPPHWRNHQFHGRDFTIFLRYGSFGFDLGITWVVVLLVMAASEIALAPFQSIPSSTIIYSVGLHYKGQRVSFSDALRASTPRLCERLTMTMIYKTLLSYSILILATLSMVLLDGIPLTILISWIVPLAVLGLVCLDIIFRLAAGVSVIEREFGWRAVIRGRKLLKDKVIPAFWFELLWFGTTVILLGFQFAFRYHIASWGTPPWCMGVVYTVFMSFLWQMNALVSGIQYASFKSYHNEVVSESIYDEGSTLKGEFELVRSDDSDMIGEQSPKFFQPGTTTVFIIE